MGRPDLDALLALAKKATPGPLDFAEGAAAEIGLPPEAWDGNVCSREQRVCTVDGPNWRNDGPYIAALSPEVVLWLVNVAKAAHLLFDDPDNCDDHDRELAKALDAVPGQGET